MYCRLAVKQLSLHNAGEMKRSVEIIYKCTPLYTVLKVLFKVILAAAVPLQFVVIQQVINAVAGVLNGGDKGNAWLWCGIFIFIDFIIILFTYLRLLYPTGWDFADMRTESS